MQHVYRLVKLHVRHSGHVVGFARYSAYPYVYHIPCKCIRAGNRLLTHYLAVWKVARHILRRAYLKLHAPNYIVRLLKILACKVRYGNIVIAGAYNYGYAIPLLCGRSGSRSLLKHRAFLLIAGTIFVYIKLKPSKLSDPLRLLKLFGFYIRYYVFSRRSIALILIYRPCNKEQSRKQAEHYHQHEHNIHHAMPPSPLRFNGVFFKPCKLSVRLS